MRLLALGLCLIGLTAQAALAADIALPAGTAISVKLADPIDSAFDRFGRQYNASIAAPVQLESGQTIPAGARATITLLHNNSGWITQLATLTVNGHTLQLTSSAGTVAAAPAPAPGLLRQIGFGAAPSPFSNQRIMLPANTQLSFRLIGSTTTARPVRAIRSSRSAPGLARASRAETGSASASEPGGIAYLCRARDRSDRLLPTSYYVADVFETSDDPIVVELRWRHYLAAKYPYRFANNPHAVIQCTRLSDLTAERDARRLLQMESKSDTAEVVQTRWRYTLGPPPKASAAAQPISPTRQQ